MALVDRHFELIDARQLFRVSVSEAANRGILLPEAMEQSRHRSFHQASNYYNNAAMESFFSSLKTETTARKVYRTRNDARADVFDYIERFYNPKRRHSTLGYLSPNDFETKVGLA